MSDIGWEERPPRRAPLSAAAPGPRDGPSEGEMFDIAATMRQAML